MQTQPQIQPSINNLERNINLSIAAIEVETEIATRLKKVARTAKMAGFRPGKVPFNMVANQYGFQVRQEVMSDAVQKLFAQAVTDQNLRVAGYPRYAPANTGHSADKFEFVATFEIYPEVMVGDLAGQKLMKPVVSVEESDVDNTLETLRKQRATYDVAERAAEKADYVVIDFLGKLDGVPFKGGEGKNYSIVLGEGRMLADFEAALMGMKSGDEKTFDLTFPADYQAELASKAVQFTVTMKVVNAPKLPAIDGEFAISLGVTDGDIAKMRGEIKANLNRELKKRVAAKIKDQVMDAMLAVSQFDVPRSLVEMEISRLQEQTVKDMESRGMNAKDVSLPPELFQEQSLKRVKLGLLLSEAIRQHDIKAAPEQIRAIIEEHAESFEEPAQMVRWYYTQADRMAEVEAMVMEDNIVQWAADKMVVSTESQRFDDIMGIKRT